MPTASVSMDLTEPQLNALDALLAGGTISEAARACSVSPRTLRDWLQQPEFRAAFLQGQQQLLHQTCMQLAAAATQALRTLIEISEDPAQKGSVRVAAAHKVLHLFLHHGPRVSALLAPPAAPAAPDPRSQVYEDMVAALHRVYGSDDETDPVPVDAPLSTAAPSEPVSPQTAVQSAASASGSTGVPSTHTCSNTQCRLPTPVGKPTASPAPTRLTLPTRSSADTPDPLPAPGVTYVPWRG